MVSRRSRAVLQDCGGDVVHRAGMNEITPHHSSLSSRLGAAIWLLTGAFIAVAVTVIGAATWSANAAPGDGDTTYVPTPGCRLVDTRPGETNNIGERDTPLGPGDTHTVQVRGDNGQCVGALAIPGDATGVALNVTAVGATAASNIRVYPADLVEPPLLSNLNVTAGGPSTPNKVDVRLSPDGAITIYNFKGRVDVVLDVVGYYTSGSLTEIDQRLAELDRRTNELEAGTGNGDGVDTEVLARLDRVEAAVAANEDDVAALDEAQPFVESGTQLNQIQLRGAPIPVVSTAVTAPVDGYVTASYSTGLRHTASGIVRCQVDTDAPGWGLDIPVGGSGYSFLTAGPEANHDEEMLSGIRRFFIRAGETVTYTLWCEEVSDGGAAQASTLVALFTPLR